jgi:hypothetical protein
MRVTLTLLALGSALLSMFAVDAYAGGSVTIEARTEHAGSPGKRLTSVHRRAARTE